MDDSGRLCPLSSTGRSFTSPPPLCHSLSCGAHHRPLIPTHGHSLSKLVVVVAPSTSNDSIHLSYPPRPSISNGTHPLGHTNNGMSDRVIFGIIRIVFSHRRHTGENITSLFEKGNKKLIGTTIEFIGNN